MTMTNVQDMIDFINSVELSIPNLSSLSLTPVDDSSEAAAARTDSTASADINAGSLISFVAGVSSDFQQDVLDSTLFAQFAANAKYDRQKDPNHWYGVYLNTLSGIAWTIQNFDFQQYKISSSSFKLDDVVLDIMKAAFSPNEYAVVKTSIDALKKLKDDDDRIKLFGHNATSSSAGNFQIGAVTETNGSVAMHTLGAYFSSTDTNTDFLFVHYKGSNTKIFKGVQTMTLNEGQYGKIRETIQQRLGKNIQDFVKSVPLAN